MAQQKNPFNKLPGLNEITVVKFFDDITVPRLRRITMFLSKYTAAVLLGVFFSVSLPALSEGVEKATETPLFIRELVNEVTVVPDPTAKERMGVAINTAWANAQQRYYALTEGWFDPSEREVKLKREIEALHKDVKFLTVKNAQQDRQLRVKHLERGVKHEEMASCAEEVFSYLRVMGGD